MRKIYFILLAILYCLTSCTFTEDVVIDQFTELYPFNYVGLVSSFPDADSIDVYYSIASGPSNVTQHVKVKPPAIIGGHFTNVTFDSTAVRTGGGWFNKRSIVDRGRRAVVDYSGSHYMKIVNNGRYSVEYFVVGSHPIKLYYWSDYYAGPASGSRIPPVPKTVGLMPEVFYNGGPVKYLLFPDEKPVEDMYKVNFEGLLLNSKDRNRPYYWYKDTDTIQFQGLHNGENIINAPWPINQVVNLFRAEYRNSQDTILTISYPKNDFKPKNIRISKGAINNGSGFSIDPALPKYYGTIPSGGEIHSSDSIPFITHVCYEYYKDKFLYSSEYESITP